jgi:glycerol-3-phosphate acyltransferase PlsY
VNHVTVDTWSIAAVGALTYLVGGVPIGWLLARSRAGIDVRGLGSGNVGTSNIYRNVDAGMAVVVGPAQFFQGLLCVEGAGWLGFPIEIQSLVAVCAVVGNGWPVYLGFNGGRGIAVATGAVAGLSLIGLGVLLACFAAGARCRQIARGVMAGFIALPIVAALIVGQARAIAFAVLLVLITLRRLEGLITDSRRYGQPLRLALLRLARDERPGRPLVGRRTDW